ncbi:lipopolysaccharide biosynthesis protein [Meiothermus sp.]|uniref:lipopolysaccharide biosynthesis protein n=1 Tax=Meiothermus sp. TaxID=1955249 RepID=UPI002631CDB2|nr:lipopolysaccharide biosynthesis protein [Meiothermus sp.]
MARWLEPTEYGAFAVGWMILLIGYQVQNPLITEPLTVYTPNRFRTAPELYQQIVQYLHWFLTGLAALVFVLLAGLQNDGVFKGLYLGLAFALPFVQYAMLIRRICYANLAPRLSALGGFLYLPLFVLSAFILHNASLLNAFTAMLLMGAASLISGYWVWWQWSRVSQQRVYGATLPFQAQVKLFWAVLRYHWRYGRWGLPASLLWILVTSLPYVLLVRFHGLESVAGLRVLENTVAPVNSFFSAFNSLMLPSFARASSPANLERMMRRYLLLFTTLGFLFWLVLALLHEPIFRLLYGANYQDIGRLLYLFALVPMATWFAEVFFSAFRAQEQPRWITWLYVLASFSTGVLGWLLIQRMGLQGAVVTVLCTQALLAIAALIFWFRLGRQRTF